MGQGKKVTLRSSTRSSPRTSQAQDTAQHGPSWGCSGDSTLGLPDLGNGNLDKRRGEAWMPMHICKRSHDDADASQTHDTGCLCV